MVFTSRATTKMEQAGLFYHVLTSGEVLPTSPIICASWCSNGLGLGFKGEGHLKESKKTDLLDVGERTRGSNGLLFLSQVHLCPRVHLLSSYLWTSIPLFPSLTLIPILGLSSSHPTMPLGTLLYCQYTLLCPLSLFSHIPSTLELGRLEFASCLRHLIAV